MKSQDKKPKLYDPYLALKPHLRPGFKNQVLFLFKVEPKTKTKQLTLKEFLSNATYQKNSKSSRSLRRDNS